MGATHDSGCGPRGRRASSKLAASSAESNQTARARASGARATDGRRADDTRADGTRADERALQLCALALQAGALAAFEWSVHGDTLMSSEGFAGLLGFGVGSASAPRSIASLLRRVHEDDRESLAREMRAAVAARRSLRAEFRVVLDDSSVRWILFRARAISGGRGKGASLVGLAEDVTESKAAEDERAALIGRDRQLRGAAEQTSRSQDELLSLFSHEVRSPLNAILGWNRILAVKRAGDAEVVDMTARIERGAMTLLKMANEMLDLGRLGTGKLKIEPRPTRLASVLVAALDAARRAAAAKGVEIRDAIETAVSDIYGDPDRLRQVVANLLANAIKLTDRGGHILVSLRATSSRIELDVRVGSQGVPGRLPPLSSGVREGGVTTRQTPGLGLELQFVREIIVRHGGSLEVVSDAPGHGAAFIVHLPALQKRDERRGEISEAHDASRGAEPPHRTLGGLSILVVDDQADARTMVAETLRLEGARVTECDSAAAALDALSARDARYDVMVTDIGMPAEDGYSLVRKLRRAPSGERVLAVALTGYASERDKEAAMLAGFDVHVAKPVDFDDFVPLIARMTRSARRTRGH